MKSSNHTTTPASKPAVLQPDLTFLASNLGELRERSQWVCWGLDPPEAGKDKWRKVPVTPGTRRLARANDPATWRPFVEAIGWFLERADHLAGIGYVFAQDDPFCGIDVDRCLDTNGRLATWAGPIVTSFPTYAERSPSGTGLKLFCRGSLPLNGTGRRVGQLEAYHHGRYFTVTGLPYGGTVAINDCQSAIDRVWSEHFAQNQTRDPAPRQPQRVAISDDEVLKLAASSRRGAKFERLFRGDWSHYQGQGEQSSADLALCSMLAALVGGDASRVDALFRQSGLMRPKWDETHSADGRTYGQMTIEKALDGQRGSCSAVPQYLPPAMQAAWRHAFNSQLRRGRSR